MNYYLLQKKEEARNSIVVILQRNSLYRAMRFANLDGILDFSLPSIILVKAGLMQITVWRSRPAWLRMTLAAVQE